MNLHATKGKLGLGLTPWPMCRDAVSQEVLCKT